MDEDEVTEDEASEDEVEMDGVGFEVGKKDREGDRGEENSTEKRSAVTVVKVVAGFEVFLATRVGVEEAGIHEAISGVEHPDSDGHGQSGRERKADLICRSDEPSPESRNGRGVEGEEMPERKRVFVAVNRSERWLGGCCGGHLISIFLLSVHCAVTDPTQRGQDDRRGGALESSGICGRIL